MKNYERDYEETMDALNAALQRRTQLDVEIHGLQERIQILEALIRADYPHKERLVLDKDVTPVQAYVNVLQPRITEKVRRTLMVADGPLTSGEIYEELRRKGMDFGQKSNPWALIHGICRRLVDQKFAREVGKDGRKAWILAKT